MNNSKINGTIPEYTFIIKPNIKSNSMLKSRPLPKIEE